MQTIAFPLLLLAFNLSPLAAAEPLVPLPVPSLTPSLPFFPTPPLIVSPPVPVPVPVPVPAVPVSR